MCVCAKGQRRPFHNCTEHKTGISVSIFHVINHVNRLFLFTLRVYFWNNNIQTRVYWRVTMLRRKRATNKRDGPRWTQSRMSDDESTIHTDYTTECINVMIHHPWTEEGKKRNFYEIDENEWNMAISTFCNSKWKQTAIEIIQSMRMRKSDTFDLDLLEWFILFDTTSPKFDECSEQNRAFQQFDWFIYCKPEH